MFIIVLARSENGFGTNNIIKITTIIAKLTYHFLLYINRAIIAPVTANHAERLNVNIRHRIPKKKPTA